MDWQPDPSPRIDRSDRQLAGLCRGLAGVRLQLGDGLEWLARSNGHQALGFPSLSAYALERLERRPGWVGEARSMSRRLADRPLTRQALMEGRISWSAAIELVKLSKLPHEDPDGPSEAEVLELGKEMTVRQLKAWRKSASPQSAVAAEETAAEETAAEETAAEETAAEETAAEETAAPDATALQEEPDVRVLQVTVDRVDAWAMEGCRTLVRPGRVSDGELVEAMLGEGLSTLFETDPELRLREDATSEEANAWLEDKARWEHEADEACEERTRNLAEVTAADYPVEPPEEVDWQALSPVEIDTRLRSLAGEMAARDLQIGRLARGFISVSGHFKLGYSGIKQWVRERLGISHASLKARMTLARRCHALPSISAAVVEGRVGFEAGSLVARIGRPNTVEAWLDRARCRTIKHLREDIELAEMLARAEGGQVGLPPEREATEEWQAVERVLRAGKLFEEEDEPEGQMSVGLEPEGQMSEDLEPESRMSEGPEVDGPQLRGPGPGRVPLKLRIDDDLVRFWHRVQDLHRQSDADGPFARWLIGNFLRVWGRTKPKDVAYGHIYERDRGVCANPCCTRTDLTPHHIVFRSRGGGEEDSNLVSLCVACHLELVHGGKMVVSGPAERARFEMGREAVVVVEGRERLAG